jgi:23S rRNA (cytosine1962-C5)-methyltransferase
MSVENATSGDYELLDFGGGRKLERFGSVVIDRPCPTAEGAPKSKPSAWKRVTARYDRTSGDQGVWTPANAFPQRWEISFAISASNSRERAPSRSDGLARRAEPATTTIGRGGRCPVAADQNSPHVELTFQLQATPFGHVGVFPEQFANWEWIVRQVCKQVKSQGEEGRPLRVLNLFAYTGGSTLAAAAAGAEVVHIDAARNIVERARRNANRSGLADRPIRWISEDATKFCQRELKRGNRYDAVILDPPSYGHGPKGESWKIGTHLLPLIAMCGELTAERRAFVLTTCHTPGIGQAELAAYLAEGFFGTCGQPPAAGELVLETREGRRLPSGVFARWPT